MRSILFHCKKFDANITGISTRGIGVAPEEVTANGYNHDNGIMVWITVEEKDNTEQILPKIKKEIERFCEETRENRIVLCPFAHLSNKLAPFKTGIEFFNQLESKFKTENKYEIVRVHFGSDKEMSLQLFGHPGNVRYREF